SARSLRRIARYALPIRMGAEMCDRHSAFPQRALRPADVQSTLIARRHLELGAWSFFGIWNLGFGIFSLCASGERFALFHKVIAAPFAVRFHHFLRRGFFRRRLLFFFALLL